MALMIATTMSLSPYYPPFVTVSGMAEPEVALLRLRAMVEACQDPLSERSSTTNPPIFLTTSNDDSQSPQTSTTICDHFEISMVVLLCLRDVDFTLIDYFGFRTLPHSECFIFPEHFRCGS
jgi:hypothetical protein